MGNSLFNIGMDSNRSQFMARQRIESLINLPRLFAAIDADPGVVGAGVVYIDADFNVVTLREFQPICSIAPKRLILREAQKYIAPTQFAQQVQDNPRESRLVGEAVNTTLSCAGAVIGWIVVLSGSVAVPFSAGASSVVVALGYTAAAASSVQCFASGYRTVNEVRNPARNDQLDSEEWYQYTMIALDAASLVGVGSSALATVKLVRLNKASTGKSVREVLRGLNRQERAKLTKELLSINDPRLTSKMIKLKQLSGELPKRFTPTEVKHATVTQIKDALGAAIGFTGSAVSGNVRTIAIGLYEEAEQ
ncbi:MULTISPECIES: NAD synthetase [unclassified Pseudomonas]|uniref:NAD synthetase n=1 Tax=unclassified Pseudomonas TaxID=196821 RepID=UPI000C88EFB6|nr:MULTISPECIES: NAD synthetase [unclassified Pseudomonas]MBJ2320807.1 NAD synthetase [Pseudomonas fluorescens]PMZ74494.1 NAD synthetase [Pseudomonas sp. GW247-3R2A]PMY76343.1 NAD synthetase [Pseudomonas sp. MPR-R3A]PMY99324.1 NAD synthetase [Pseudomonas sp. FW305-124]PNA96942.1 NAD synthetase [Pseudomonas sp. FW300-E2]